MHLYVELISLFARVLFSKVTMNTEVENMDALLIRETPGQVPRQSVITLSSNHQEISWVFCGFLFKLML